VELTVLDLWLDSMILKVACNLNNSMILCSRSIAKIYGAQLLASFYNPDDFTRNGKGREEEPKQA